MTSRKRIALAAAGLALAGDVVAAPAAPAAPSAPSAGHVEAAANRCSGWKEIHITGGAAKYMECTKKVNGKSYVSGAFYLWDTKRDGKAVQAYAETDYNHWYGDDVTWQHFYGWTNDTHGSPKISTGWHRGNDFGLVIDLRWHRCRGDRWHRCPPGFLSSGPHGWASRCPSGDAFCDTCLTCLTSSPWPGSKGEHGTRTALAPVPSNRDVPSQSQGVNATVARVRRERAPPGTPGIPGVAAA